jgi:hypothetical protein
MTEEEFYDAMSDRYSSLYFRQDKYPDESLIIDILRDATAMTPVFNHDWHHKVDVYGPEFYLDKRKVCLQTAEKEMHRRMFRTKNRNGEDNKGISEFLEPKLKKFEEWIESGNAKKYGYHGVEESFNTQVLAPYLLKFTYSYNQFINRAKNDGPGAKLKALQSSMAHALAIAAVATHHGLNVGFCGCHFPNSHNKNRIWYDDDEMIKFVGIGYQHENCHYSKDSYMRSMQRKPRYNNICRINRYK